MQQPNLFDDAPSDPPRHSPPATASPVEPVPVDQGDRDFAADPSNHVVLEASAGTGKTRVLVERYVNLIEAGVDPRNILAITFTRKAAAEMRDRVLRRLAERRESSAALAERWRTLKDRVADVNISTIDAFCFGLLREFPLEADVDPAFEIADETEVPRFRAEAVELTLRACRETLIGDEAVRLLLAMKGTNALTHALSRLLDERHVALAAVREFAGRDTGAVDVAAACRAFVDRLARALGHADLDALLARGPMASPRFARLAVDLAAIAEGTFDISQPTDVRRVQRALEWYFLTKDRKPRQRLVDDVKSAFAATVHKGPHSAAMGALAPDIGAAIDGLAAAVNGVLARGLLRVLEVAVAEFDRLMDEHSVLDFPAMLARAVELLRRQEEFARSRLKLQSRYHHLLVDEFQDTSQAQWDLVVLLTESWAEGVGLTEESGGLPPSIFIVGDRKQSIYRFRHAEVTLMHVAAEFIGALRPGVTVRRAIQQSFRAVPELLAFVNAVAGEMTSDAAIPERFEYRDIDRFPGVSVGPGALRDGQPVLGAIVGRSIDDTAAAVADEIARLLASDTLVRDRRGMRPLQPDDIAVLFRSRAGHRIYEDALDRRGVRTYVYKGLGFFDTPEVLDLVALLRFLARPDSSLRAAALLRSRFMRLSDAGLAALAPDLSGALRGASVPGEAALGPLDAAVLARARASVGAWLDAADRVPPAALVDRVLAETAYLRELAGPRWSQARENVKKVRALIRRVQNRGYATFERLADYFRRLAAGEEANAIVAARGCVQLMTVHSAKGLEFPVVFLVRMHAGTGDRTPAISVVARDEAGAPEVAISMTSRAAKIERVRDLEESRRLLYVALTRAKDRLYLSAELADDTPVRRGFFSLLPSGLRQTLSAVPTTSEAPTVTWTSRDGEAFTFGIGRPDPAPVMLPAEAARPSEAPVDDRVIEDPSLPRVGVTEVSVDPPAVRGRSRRTAAATSPASDRLVGRLVHRCFQYGLDAADGLALTERVRVWAAELREATDAAGTATSEEAVARAAAMYAAMRSEPALSALLASGECFYEVPVSLRRDDPPRIARGQIDALVVPPDGPIMVVDFKTGRPGPADDAQVAVYREALAAAWPGRTVESRLFYFRSGNESP